MDKYLVALFIMFGMGWAGIIIDRMFSYFIQLHRSMGSEEAQIEAAEREYILEPNYPDWDGYEKAVDRIIRGLPAKSPARAQVEKRAERRRELKQHYSRDGRWHEEDCKYQGWPMDVQAVMSVVVDNEPRVACALCRAVVPTLNELELAKKVAKAAPDMTAEQIVDFHVHMGEIRKRLKYEG